METRRASQAAPLAILAVLAVLADAGCRRPPVPPEHVRVDDLSVVLVILDAAGARYFGAYGNPLATSPVIDSLAQSGGTLFERAYAQSAWTLPSAASFLTGRYPPRRRQTRTVVEGETLPLLLHDAGFQTAAFSENPYVTTDFGFAGGFDVFHEYFPDAVANADPRFYRVESDRTTTDAIAWFEANGQGRLFLYLHLLTPHSPYQPPAPFDGRFDPDYTGSVDGVTDTLLRVNEGTLAVSERDLEHLRLRYQENLAYGDHQVGRLLEGLRRAGRLDRTIVIVAADHGEAFREHGWMLHTTTLFEEMIHVPLVIRFPPRFGGLPARWGGIVELRDLVPTLCGALRLTCGVGTARSLLQLMRARRAPVRAARAWTSDAGPLALGALVTGHRKLVMDARAHRVALYDLESDPGEKHDLSATELSRSRRLARRLRAGHESALGAPGPRAVGSDTARKLHALGYTQ